MNKLFKLIYVNLLELFDINKIMIAREDGIKSNLEKRLVLSALIGLFYGYVIYLFLTMLKINDKFLLLSVGFIVSTFVCFISDMQNIESALFKGDDNDVLFSFPISRYQILFSKLFTVYLRNLLIVLIIMLATFLAFYKQYKSVTDTMVLMYILSSFIIPLVPMVIATIISYYKDYFKVKYNNSNLYKIIKNGLFIVVIMLVSLLFIDVKISDLNTGIIELVNKLTILVPFNYLFYNALKLENIIYFILLIVITIFITYVYMLVINNNYLKICSRLKGIKKKEVFHMKKTKNMKKVFGMFRKEILNMLNIKIYLFSSFGVTLIFTIMLFLVLNFIDIDKVMSMKNVPDILNLYLPTLLAMIVTFGCSTISSFSLEKDNIQILKTLPISMGKVLVGKWLVNVIIGSIFIVINGSLTWIYFKYNGWNVMFNYLLPFIALLFVSFSGLVLDYRFIEKMEKDEHVIVKQRLVTMVPTFLSIFIGMCPFFLKVYNDYKYVLGSYMLAMIIGLVIEIIYIIIKKEKLIKGLIN